MATKDDRMLVKVLSQKALREKYDYNPAEFNSIWDAKHSDNPVVKAVAMLIEETSKESDQSEIFKMVFNHLNMNML